MTFRHRAGVSPYTSSFDFAETCGFVNQSLEPLCCDPKRLRIAPHPPGHPLSRSYGANLPNSLTKVSPFALVFSTRLPVSVCGTGAQTSTLRGFSRQAGSTTYASGARYHASAQPTDLPIGLDTYAFRTFHVRWEGWSTSLRHPFALLGRFRNIDRMSITYALRPRLRPD